MKLKFILFIILLFTACNNDITYHITENQILKMAQHSYQWGYKHAVLDMGGKVNDQKIYNRSVEFIKNMSGKTVEGK